MIATPVRLPPGRAKLATRPRSTGSPPLMKTTGIVGVASFAALAVGAASAAITSTSRWTRSAASNANWSFEERGFESVWAPEHSHIPLSRKTPFPGGGELPRPYYDAMDPFVVLAAAAEATRTIKLGTGVALIQQRDTIQTAKLVASIDQASEGRFLFGVGGGWNQDEMEDHGTVYATRFKRVREAIEAMKEIWTKSETEYHGEFVNFDPMIARPKSVQKPYPPIHVGGAFPHGARRAIRYGDGWIPTARGDVTEVLPKFREMAREAGRDPASIEITSFALGEDTDTVKRLAEMGVARVVPMFPPEKAETVLPIVDR